MRLSECSAGQAATVIRIEEAAEWDLDLLTFLERHQIKPGKTLDILDVATFNDTITVASADGDVVLGNKAAERVWVHPTTATAEDASVVPEPAAVAG